MVFLVFPHYCLGRGLMDMATEENLNAAISQFGLESVRSRFAFAFLGKYMLCLLVQGVVFFLLTLAIQAGLAIKNPQKKPTQKTQLKKPLKMGFLGFFGFFKF